MLSRGFSTALLLVAATFAVPPRVATKTQQPATGAITGVVLDGTSNAPVEGALVYLTRGGVQPSGAQPRVMTDDGGRFVFTELVAAEDYQIFASRAGYASSTYGRDFNAGTNPAKPISITPGQWISGIRIRMWRGATVSGVVTDESGEPVVNAFVRALALMPIAGRLQMAVGPLTKTDDRGMYRLSGLLAGRYLIQVPASVATAPASLNDAAVGLASSSSPSMPRVANRAPTTTGAIDAGASGRILVGPFVIPPPPADGRLSTYPITFHPSSTSVEHATAIDVRPGQHQQADIRLMPASATIVSGRVEGPADVVKGLIVRLVLSGLEELGLGSEAAVTSVEPNGSFVFLNVPPGVYTIETARPFGQFVLGQSSLFAEGPRLPAQLSQGQNMNAYFAEAAPPGTSLTIEGAYGVDNVTLFGQRTVTVGSTPESSLSVPLRHAGTVSGRIVIELDPKQPNVTPPRASSLRLEAANGSARFGGLRPRPSETAADSWSIDGVQPAQYFVRLNTGLPWTIKAVTWDGRDYLDTPLDATAASTISGVTVTITNARPTLSGVVRDERGVADAGVIAFPTNAALWTNFGVSPPRIEATMAGADGAFRMQTLPAGEYFVIAVPRSDIDAWLEPGFFKRAQPLATRITLQWGQTTTTDLVLKSK